MEKRVLPALDPNKALLMRYVDDFLLATTDPKIAREFLAVMNRGIFHRGKASAACTGFGVYNI